MPIAKKQLASKITPRPVTIASEYNLRNVKNRIAKGFLLKWNFFSKTLVKRRNGSAVVYLL